MKKSIDLPSNLAHVICHYYRQWIPGDERGFRSRGHRIHSSGDYNNPPPQAEHAGLRRYLRSRMKGPPVRLTSTQRKAVGEAFIRKLHKMGAKVIVIAVGPTHMHAMLSPMAGESIEKQIGKAKQFASLKCPDHSGQMWGEGLDAIAVETREHARDLFAYIRDHEEEGAWVWRVDRNSPPLARS